MSTKDLYIQKAMESNLLDLFRARDKWEHCFKDGHMGFISTDGRLLCKDIAIGILDKEISTRIITHL